MKINEDSIPSWIFEVISPDQLYFRLNSSSTKTKEIEIEYHNDKYRLIFQVTNNVCNMIKICKRNPQGIWYNIYEGGN